VGAKVTPGAPHASRESLQREMSDTGLSPTWWSNGPGDTYGAHEHGYHKVLYCFTGSIVFHTDEGDIAMKAGDRLDLDEGTRHSATVGPEGVVCAESPR